MKIGAAKLDPDDRERLLALLDLLRDQTLDARQEAELHRLVTTDDAAAAMYVEHMQLTAALRWRHASPSFAEPVAPMRVERRRWRWWSAPRLAIAASVAAAGVALAAYLVASAATEPTDEAERPAVAVMLDGVGVSWVSEPLDPGAAIRPGRIAIGAGEIEFESTRGVALRLTGPAELELAAPDRVTLRRGRLRADAGNGAAGFTVDAPRGVRVVDLSTAFGVEVDEAGGSRVTVTSGAVEVDAAEAGQRTELAEGWSATLVDGRFEAIYRPGASLTLSPDADTYVDRRYPDKALGGEPIVVANEWPDSGPRWAYLRFNLSAVHGRIIRAKLELTTEVGQSRPEAYEVHGLPGSIAWSEIGEDAMTWNTAPARNGDRIDPSQTHGGKPLTRFTTTATRGQKAIAFDAEAGPIIDFLSGAAGGTVTLVIAAPHDAATATGDAWLSRQGKSPPRLTLTTIERIDPSILWPKPAQHESKETSP